MDGTIDVTTALELFKIAMGVTHKLRDVYYKPRLESAARELIKKGIDLDTSATEDNMLLCDYAEWLYRNRDSEKQMPQNLILRIKNRVVEKRGVTDG